LAILALVTQIALFKQHSFWMRAKERKHVSGFDIIKKNKNKKLVMVTHKAVLFA